MRADALTKLNTCKNIKEMTLICHFLPDFRCKRNDFVNDTVGAELPEWIIGHVYVDDKYRGIHTMRMGVTNVEDDEERGGSGFSLE